MYIKKKGVGFTGDVEVGHFEHIKQNDEKSDSPKLYTRTNISTNHFFSTFCNQLSVLERGVTKVLDYLDTLYKISDPIIFGLNFSKYKLIIR